MGHLQWSLSSSPVTNKVYKTEPFSRRTIPKQRPLIIAAVTITEAQRIDERGMIVSEAEADIGFIWNCKRVGNAIMLSG